MGAAQGGKDRQHFLFLPQWRDLWELRGPMLPTESHLTSLRWGTPAWQGVPGLAVMGKAWVSVNRGWHCPKDKGSMARAWGSSSAHTDQSRAHSVPSAHPLPPTKALTVSLLSSNSSTCFTHDENKLAPLWAAQSSPGLHPVLCPFPGVELALIIICNPSN
jgi:hypothetical protein